LSIVALSVLPALAKEQYYYYHQGDDWARDPPRKIINLKLGLAYDMLYSTSGGSLCDSSDGLVGQFGLTTGFYPWTAEVNFYTDVGVEVYGGFFYPALRLGPGWLAFSAGLLARTSRESTVPSWASSCAADSDTEFAETLGVGATVEYLMFTGHLGFYVEVKQTVLEPFGTSVTGGISVSPLLYLLYRDY